MEEQKCRWKSKYSLYECSELALPDDSDGYCILHSKDENKRGLPQKVEERMRPSGPEIDLRGCYFPKNFDSQFFKNHAFDKCVNFREATFSLVANFREATFSQKVDFVGVKFIDDVDFFKVKFLKEAIFNLTKFSGRSNFIGATFSQRAGFSQITFSQSVNFNLATFSKGASFWETIFFEKASFENVTFSKAGSFIRASFEKEAKFNGAIFKKAANFDQTSFKGKTDFTWAEFWDWTFFFKNSNETSVKLENLNVVFPNYLKEKIGYDTLSKRLIFVGVMSTEERDQLLELSQGDSYKSAIKELFERSQGLYLGNPAIFCYTRFLGKEVIFQDGNLSRCSFLHSNIDGVDFRYCEFAKKDERLLWVFPHQRQNVLMDELEADELLEGSQDSMGHSERSEESRPSAYAQGDRNKKLREEEYEPVRRLYLELKRNFEDKKDWNTAGDFHYGEMECRRKGRLGGWPDFLLVTTYYGASGYGERPWRALLWWFFSTLLFFPLLYRLSEHDPLSACVWDSVRVATFMKIGIPIEPESWGRIVLTLQYFICPTLLALFALALRRKVKR